MLLPRVSKKTVYELLRLIHVFRELFRLLGCGGCFPSATALPEGARQQEVANIGWHNRYRTGVGLNSRIQVSGFLCSHAQPDPGAFVPRPKIHGGLEAFSGIGQISQLLVDAGHIDECAGAQSLILGKLDRLFVSLESAWEVSVIQLIKRNIDVAEGVRRTNRRCLPVVRDSAFEVSLFHE